MDVDAVARVLLSEKPSCKNAPTEAANKRFTHLAIAGEKADALRHIGLFSAKLLSLVGRQRRHLKFPVLRLLGD